MLLSLQKRERKNLTTECDENTETRYLSPQQNQSNLREERLDDVVTAGSCKVMTYQERLKILQSRDYS